MYVKRSKLHISSPEVVVTSFVWIMLTENMSQVEIFCYSNRRSANSIPFIFHRNYYGIRCEYVVTRIILFFSCFRGGEELSISFRQKMSFSSKYNRANKSGMCWRLTFPLVTNGWTSVAFLIPKARRNGCIIPLRSFSFLKRKSVWQWNRCVCFVSLFVFFGWNSLFHLR